MDSSAISPILIDMLLLAGVVAFITVVAVVAMVIHEGIKRGY